VADADGENAQSALSSPEPSSRRLVARRPPAGLCVLRGAQAGGLRARRGHRPAPAGQLQGLQQRAGLVARRALAGVTLSRDGGSQLYQISASGGEPRRLTQSQSIDTEPAFSPDGKTLYFVSDRGGAPQIYRMPAGGGAQRVTFGGNYNVSPSLSPDGRWMAYIARTGAFKLNVMDLASGTSAITDTGDESPSFAPNSKLIVYATRQGGREALMTTTVDGKIKARLAGQGGDCASPPGARSR
jgi:TolB protein